MRRGPRSLPRNRRPRSAAGRTSDDRCVGASRSATSTSTSERRDVGAVAAGVHPHRPADRARNTDGPLEARSGRGRRLAGQDRQRDRRAGPHDRSVDVDLEPVGDGVADTRSREPGVGDQQVRAAAEHDHRAAPTGRSPRRRRSRSVERRDRDEDGRRATDPVRGQRTDRHVELGRASRARDGRRTAASSDRSGCRCSARRAGHRAPPSGNVAMSPQPIEMQTSPARASLGDEANEVVASRHPHEPLLRMGIESRR